MLPISTRSRAPDGSLSSPQPRSYRPTSEALDQQGAAPGRPGVHAIDMAPVRLVSPAQLRALQIAACRFQRPDDPSACVDPRPQKDVTAFASHFRAAATAGDEGTSVFEPNAFQARSFLSNVRQGKQHGDMLVATINAEQIGDQRGDLSGPPEALQTLAQEALASGADIVLVTGRGDLGPVQIHHPPGGAPRPIFYGLGRLADTAVSLIVRSTIGTNELLIEIFPVETNKGVTRLASRAAARAALDRFQALSPSLWHQHHDHHARRHDDGHDPRAVGGIAMIVGLYSTA